MKKGKFRKAIFAVTYSKNSKGNLEYVILRRKKHWRGWEFPKGKIEKFETKRKAAKREVFEETGLKHLKVKKFHIKGLYRYKKKLKDRPNIIGQTYTLFAVKVNHHKNIIIDSIEHSFGKWMDFKEAEKKLTWPNQKKCLRIVNNFLEKNKR